MTRITRAVGMIGAVAVAAVSIAFAPTAATADTETSATPVVRPVSSLIDMPTSYPFQEPVPVPPVFESDASVSRGLLRYDQIAPIINEWLASSDLVSAQVVGRSEQGRDIHLVTVTAPETAAETAQQNVWRDEVKNNAAAAATDAELLAGYKVPVWYNANIHGNEWEGTDGLINYISELLADDSPETAELVNNHRLYFTLSNNPDGRALGQRATAAGFDPNRDMITGATAEASIVRDLSSILQPTNFIDIHGYTGVLQVEPCGPPHGENYEYDLFLPYAYDAALAIERAVVAADIEGNTYLDPATGRPTEVNTGSIKIPFRDIRSGWDDWPPIFAPQYVAFQGAITNTVELPLGRGEGENLTQDERNRRGVVNTEVTEVVVSTTTDWFVDNSDALLANQIEIFQRGAAGEPIATIPADIDPATVPAPNAWAEIWDETDVYPTELPRGYVIPIGAGQRSDTDATTLVDQLLVNAVQVQRLTAPLTVDGVTYAAGSYYVDMHQPLRGLANVLLADGTDISERVPRMYDLSAWSLSLLWGADVVSFGSTTDAAPAVSAERILATPGAAALPAAGQYLELAASGVAEFQAINELLFDGVPVSRFDDGTVIIGPDAASRQSASEVLSKYRVSFTGSDGERLNDEESVPLGSQTVGYTVAVPRDGNRAAADRQTLEKLGFRNVVEVSAAGVSSGAIDLGEIDVLFVSSVLTYTGQGVTGTPAAVAGIAAVQGYLAGGGGVVGRGTAGARFANEFGLLASTPVAGRGDSNGIVRVTTPENALLADFAQDTAFVAPAVWFTGLAPTTTVERSYAAESPFVSGHWLPSNAATPTNGQAAAAGQPAAVSSVSASGSRTFLFGTDPAYRAHPVGGFSDLATSLHWAGVAGVAVEAPTEVVVPEPGEPAPGEPAPGQPVPGEPAPGEPAPGQPAPGSPGQPSPADPVFAGGGDGDLAITGADILGAGWIAAGALTLGAALWMLGRRKRDEQPALTTGSDD